jgi:hypothetical protein
VSDAQRIMHGVLVVVSMMDERDTVIDTLLFRASMPTLAPLFREGEERIALKVAVERALELVEAEA